MAIDLIKTNLMAITTLGIAITLAGFCLYSFRELATPYMRYLLPIPPIGVAAYIFVFNMFGKYNGQLPKLMPTVFREILMATLFSSLFFLLLTLMMVLIIIMTKNL